jgi:hypothetical protein
MLSAPWLKRLQTARRASVVLVKSDGDSDSDSDSEPLHIDGALSGGEALCASLSTMEPPRSGLDWIPKKVDWGIAHE